MARNVKTIDTAIRTERREMNGDIYSYELHKKEGAHTECYGLPLYTINVEMRARDGAVTRAEARDRFLDPGHAICFFEKLVRNLATPIDLPYIIEDEL